MADIEVSQEIIHWFKESNPWTKYRTLVDLLEKPETDTEVQSARNEMLDHPMIKDLVYQTRQWFPESITRHNIPYLSHYQLMMLAEFGFTINDHQIQDLVKTIHKHVKDDLFAIRQELPQKNFTKPNPEANEWHALPCDSPLVSYSLLKMGDKSKVVMDSVEKLKNSWLDKKGWFCNFFFVESQFKKQQIGCPMAGLMALQVFSLFDELKESDLIQFAFAPINYHFESKKSLYYFGRSKKFWTFKYPFVWYNALYLADVLTRFPVLKKEKVVKQIIEWIENAADTEGRYKPTSMFKPYKDWDFSNKKEASPWISFLVQRVLKQYQQ
jgi:hypothetical protein